MPYINPALRDLIDKQIDDLIKRLEHFNTDSIDGVLNYVITRLLKSLYAPRYFNYNRAIGLLECIKQEFYRCVVAPYEMLKRKEHGDVE